MHIDLLTASISPGLYAPLALMVGGFLLALVCLVLWLVLRRKRAKPAKPRATTDEVATADEAVSADLPAEAAIAAAPMVAPAPASAPTPAPAPAATGRRRRSLVGGAERDEGTPSGEPPAANGHEFDDEAEPHIADTNLDADEHDDELADGNAHVEYDENLDDPAIDEEPHDEIEWIENDEAQSDFASGEDEANVPAAFALTNTPGAGDEAHETTVCAEVKAARQTPIVFRQFLPQTPGTDGLSFYGGQPIGPENFQWPRERGAQGGAPLQFLMQWDCAELAGQDPTGLLPQDGVLYCFVNCDRDDEEDFLQSHAFVHHRGSSQAWGPVEIPEDAGPALGRTAAFKLSGCTDCVPDAEDYVPRVMPRFPFAPIAFTLPDPLDNDPRYWSDAQAGEALLNLQKSSGTAPAPTSELDVPRNEKGRPFPVFPHDFGAIRVIASHMIEALKSPDPVLAEALYSDLSPEERDAQFGQWFEEAKELYLLGTQRPEGHRLESNISDDIWNWFDARRGVLGGDLNAIVVEAVDLSLSVSSEALSLVPAEWIDKAMDAHALAREYESDGILHIHAATPARMFGPPSYADSVSDTLVDEHILLLELPSGSGPQHDFGGKTLQYWITPDDLADGKFDRVKSVVIDA
ncbi:DUF1963 domain-containing protein [Erythrobacter sp. SCSIO 43205]|uniref:DUF1963 domain-containing protein n=1 Tax=Erythrobacter sp. SCSIO 43205 TaxID=2779361 RepID=UPI001CA8458E|nr:DUF1963 domain-containing protein [Erythrobacter sp. SCSIO 43205]UAB77746.1 DUF1963 domain-containing protein [Erythrobacter sp. SCSIO 43205]